MSKNPKPRRLAELVSKIDLCESVYIFVMGGRPARPVAYLRMQLDDTAPWISSIFVEPRYRGDGLGSQLLTRALAIAREQKFETVGLSVADNNPRALELYRRFGFRKYLAGTDGYTTQVIQL